MALPLNHHQLFKSMVVLLLVLPFRAEAHNNKTAYAIPLSGITIDGKLDDWPQRMALYPIDRVSSSYKLTPPEGPEDLTASFRVGYNLERNLLYLAIAVQDEELVVHPEAPSYDNQDLCEVYVDADHSGNDDAVPLPGGAQQYLMVPGPGKATNEVDGNPALAGGSTPTSGVQAASLRLGSTTVYEWAIPLFEAFPDKRLQIQPGKTIGFDIAVVDADGQERGNWVAWSPGAGKAFNFALFGDLVFVKEYQGLQVALGKVVPVDYSDAGAIIGQVVDGAKGTPIRGARVETWKEDKLEQATHTDSAGNYRQVVLKGTYAIKVFARGIRGKVVQREVEVYAAKETRVDLSLDDLGTCFYVDDDALEEGDGSAAHPFQTIQQALDATSEGDTIRVLSGTYREPMVLVSGVTLLAMASSSFAAQSLPQLLPHRFSDALVIGGLGKGGCIPIGGDEIEDLLVHGAFVAPHAGDTLTAVDGSVCRWEHVAFQDGKDWIEREPEAYAYATFDSETDRVALLEATGYALVYVNGEPRVGENWAYGPVSLPVALKKGLNEFLFVNARRFSAELVACPSEQPWFLRADDTLPDLLVGESAPVEIGLVVENPLLTAATGLAIELRHPDGTVTRTALPDLLPCSAYKARATLAGTAIRAAGPVPIDVTLVVGEGDTRRSIAARSLLLRAVDSNAQRNVSFVSAIDGSVQYYTVVPPVAATDGTPIASPGLILALHGGGGDRSEDLARRYTPKDFAIIVCPNNRRPLGFNWEDWGRLDAMEVLALAQQRFHTDPRRQWLTGVSMGGHGTWQLGAHYPDRFAAIAPSAAWISFRFGEYRGAGTVPGERDVADMFLRARSPSQQLLLGRNYSGLGVYVLHGGADEAVPIAQARAMRRYLAAEDGGNHPDFVYYERPGVPHDWGNQYADWPPLMRFLSEHTLPDPEEVDRVEFITAAPFVSSTCRWVTIDQQIEPMRPSSVAITRRDGGYEGTTSNVARIGLAVPKMGDGPIVVKLDGTEVQVPRPSDRSVPLWLARDGDAWRVDDVRGGKTSARGGPFREAFRNHMLFVYGTAGDDASDARLLAKARYDAETWWRRANGAVKVIPDTAFDAKADIDRNVVLYGNADTNRAWRELLTTCPVLVRNGSVKVGDREIAGDDLACVFVYPRAGSATASVGVVAGTSAIGDRLTWRFFYFWANGAYPDLAVFSPDSVNRDAAGIRLAGFFSNRWTVEGGTWAETSAPTR